MLNMLSMLGLQARGQPATEVHPKGLQAEECQWQVCQSGCCCI